jgi:hypothetical protein
MCNVYTWENSCERGTWLSSFIEHRRNRMHSPTIKIPKIFFLVPFHYGTRRSSLRHWKSQVNWPNPSIRTVTPLSTRPLTEMSTRNLHGVKCCRRIRLKTSQPSVRRLSRKCGSLDVSQLDGSTRPIAGISLFCYTNHVVTLLHDYLDPPFMTPNRMEPSAVVSSNQNSASDTTPSTRPAECTQQHARTLALDWKSAGRFWALSAGENTNL